VMTERTVLRDELRECASLSQATTALLLSPFKPEAGSSETKSSGFTTVLGAVSAG